METAKARARRLREGFFDRFCSGVGIDIGAGGMHGIPLDPLFPDIRCWDLGDGDATFMAGVPNEAFDFVYSSHCLEHIWNPWLALRNWWRILKPGGHLIVYVPHRDLYEKKRELPSRFNPDHKFFILPWHDDLPYTLGLGPLVLGAVGPGAALCKLAVCDEGWEPVAPTDHSYGEYAIEMVVQKLPSP